MLTYTIFSHLIRFNESFPVRFWVKLGWFVFVLMFISLKTFASDGKNLPGGPGNKNRYGKNKIYGIRTKNIGDPYLEVGAGYGLWYQSHQSRMENYRNPIEAFVEYGRTGRPLSYQLGVNLNTAFAQEIFVLKPRLVFAGAKYTLPDISSLNNLRVHPYGTAGIVGWQTNLTDRVYPGIVSYEFKTEKDTGVGAYGGAGISFKYKRLTLSPQFTYYLTGTGQYLAGAFEKQDINTGYMTATIRLSYRFTFRANKVVCPAYN